MDLAAAGYRSPEDFVAVVHSFADRAGPRATLEQIGTTVGGRPIDAVTVRGRPGDADDRAQVLVVACMHGCEVISSELAVAVLADYCGPEPHGAAAAVLAVADVTVVPCVNVDGRTAAMASLDRPGWFANAPRRNANGVDLNRNWPFPEGVDDHWLPIAGTGLRHLPWYRGTAPLSEPEAAALAGLAERLRPAVVLNLHSTGNILTHPWSAKLEAPADQEGFEAMVAAFRATQRIPYRSKQSRNWYPIIGSSNDWFYDRFGALAMMVETSPPAGSVKADLRRAGRFFWYANPTDPQRWIDNDRAGCTAAALAGLRWLARRDAPDTAPPSVEGSADGAGLA